MFGSSTLEVAIGLIFVYLLLSLICSAANEIIATNSKRRAKILERGILNLLTDPPLDKKIRESFKAKERLLPKDPVIPDTPPEPERKLSRTQRLGQRIKRVREGESILSRDQGPTLGSIFYEHPLIKTLYQPRWYFVRERKPAYIPASTFTRTLLDIVTPVELGEKSQIDAIREQIVQSFPENSNVRRSLLVFIDESKSGSSDGEAFNKLRENVEDWFNKSMDRVTDWYKRRTQRMIFLLAFGMVVILNADTVMIFQVLYHEPSVRATVMTEAQEYAKSEAAAARNSPATPSPTPATSSSDLAPTEGVEEPSNGGTMPTDGGLDFGLTPSPSPTPTPIEVEQAQTREKYQEILSKYQHLGIPLGWDNIPGQIPRRPAWIKSIRDWNGWGAWLLKLVGLLLTAAAITLGAPFWFDILNRFISFRTAVKPPEATPQKQPELMSLTTPQRLPEEHVGRSTATKTTPETETSETEIPETVEGPVEGDEGADEPS